MPPHDGGKKREGKRKDSLNFRTTPNNVIERGNSETAADGPKKSKALFNSSRERGTGSQEVSRPNPWTIQSRP